MVPANSWLCASEGDPGRISGWPGKRPRISPMDVSPEPSTPTQAISVEGPVYICIPFKPESSVWCADPRALFRPSSFGASPGSSLAPLDTAVAMAILQIPALIHSFRMKLDCAAKADKSLGDGDGPLSRYTPPRAERFRARPSKAHNHSIVTVHNRFLGLLG
jgi:hypothetical protein